MKLQTARVFVVVACVLFALTGRAFAQAGPSPKKSSMTVTGSFGTLPVDSFTGDEAISSLFEFEIWVTPDAAHPISYDATLGTEVSASLTAGDTTRHFSGICARISQGVTGKTSYRLDLVPKVGLLALNEDSRIFQNKSVPEILQTVLGAAGIEARFTLARSYAKRNAVVQYRESDFNFISRLMEEEGIFYYFNHNASGHTMVIGDNSSSNPLLDGSATFLPAVQQQGVTSWQKTQELRPAKVTLWDFNFQLPDKHLEASQTIQDSVSAGRVTHHLSNAATSNLEVFDYPGGYAKHFDSTGELPNIFTENRRVASTRMEELAASALVVGGNATLAQFTAGSRFNLAQHPDADGQYLLTSVHHQADQRGAGFDYQNHFTAIPGTLPFRPRRAAPRPVIGTQTATVVGPAGEELYTDGLSRVKVQFHWDRQGKSDENSSMWIRVGALHAGQENGFTAVPKIGQEVVVAFLEGDPDQPIIIGSTYNPNRIPPP